MVSFCFVMLAFRYFFGVYVCCVTAFMWFVLFFVEKFFMVFWLRLMYDLGYADSNRCDCVVAWFGCIFKLS